jgi:hypothetical protein
VVDIYFNETQMIRRRCVLFAALTWAANTPAGGQTAAPPALLGCFAINVLPIHSAPAAGMLLVDSLWRQHDSSSTAFVRALVPKRVRLQTNGEWWDLDSVRPRLGRGLSWQRLTTGDSLVFGAGDGLVSWRVALSEVRRGVTGTATIRTDEPGPTRAAIAASRVQCP